MKGLVINTAEDSWAESKGFKLVDLEQPQLDETANPNDATSVIVKMHYAGVCGSDRGLWYRQAFKDLFHESLAREGKTQRIVGHEFVGEIVAMGSAVAGLYSDPDPLNKAKVEVGSLVSGDSHVTCGRCYQCRIGEANVCLNEAILGISIDGVFAEYAKLPAKNLWPVDPSRVRPEIAAIFDPFGNAVHALTKVDVRGQRVVIFGCGPIGLFSLLLAKDFGAAKVIMVDVNPANIELAKQLGADETILIESSEKAQPWESDKAALDAINKLTYGKGVDVALEMAGPASSINNAIDSVRRGGQVVLFGIKDGDVTIPNFPRIITRGVTIHSVIGRELFKTWQISQRVLSDKTNGIQDKIWEIILKRGEGTMINFAEFESASFETSMNEQPKLLFKF